VPKPELERASRKEPSLGTVPHLEGGRHEPWLDLNAKIELDDEWLELDEEDAEAFQVVEPEAKPVVDDDWETVQPPVPEPKHKPAADAWASKPEEPAPSAPKQKLSWWQTLAHTAEHAFDFRSTGETAMPPKQETKLEPTPSTPQPAVGPEAEPDASYDEYEYEQEEIEWQDEAVEVEPLVVIEAKQPVMELPDKDLPVMLLAINVVARGAYFEGEEIVVAINDLGLKASDMQIFHRVEPDGNRVVFSMSSMVEPGRFPFEQMEEFATPGLTLFTQLPGPIDSMVTYNGMLYAADQLAQMLDGELQDESHSVLSRQTIEHTRSEIMEHRRQVQLAIKRRGRR
jgi:cell division protein ZipA